MKSLVHTEELCSQGVTLEHAPGAKSLVCIGLNAKREGSWRRHGGVRNLLTSLISKVCTLQNAPRYLTG